MANLQIYQYYACKELDYMLLQWMERMRIDEELDHTLSTGNGTPSLFLNFFQYRRLYFTADSFGNLTRACWVEPCMGAAFMGFYIAPPVRHVQKEKVFFLYDIINEIFHNDIPTIAGFIQERSRPELTQKFIKLHERLGYTYVGKLSKFFDGRDCYCVQLTKEDWIKGNGWITKWKASRGYATELHAATAR